MKKKFSILIALIGWFAVITQFVLMMQNRTASTGETIIRFFSFFTILTNILVATYFTAITFEDKNKNSLLHKPGTLMAITLYITIVGLVYQFALRPLWNPEGMQMIVDELLHSVIPLCCIIFCFLYEHSIPIRYAQVFTWLAYPLLYLLFILIRGNISDFYPYPFIDVSKIGMEKVYTNSIYLLVLFGVMALLFIFTGKKLTRR